MVVLVCGGRHYNRAARVFQVLDGLDPQPSLIVNGSPKRKRGIGADEFASNWAIARGVTLQEHPANWVKYGLRAGPIRNQEMLTHLKAAVMFGDTALVVAFQGGRGTADMIRRAEGAGIQVKKVDEPWTTSGS